MRLNSKALNSKALNSTLCRPPIKEDQPTRSLGLSVGLSLFILCLLNFNNPYVPLGFNKATCF